MPKPELSHDRPSQLRCCPGWSLSWRLYSGSRQRCFAASWDSCRKSVLGGGVGKSGFLLTPSLLPSNVPLPYWGRRPPPLLRGGLLGNGRGWVRCHHPASLDAAVTLPKTASLHGRWRAATNAAQELACSSSKEEALGRFTTAARCHGVTAISRD